MLYHIKVISTLVILYQNYHIYNKNNDTLHDTVMSKFVTY